jgi:NitT/TauT family transport system substrate-binding protein
MAAVVCSFSAGPARAQEVLLRVGHFPNVTHVQALVARNLERQGQPWFTAERLGRPVRIEWYAYNAGPSAMEAIFAGSLDLIPASRDTDPLGRTASAPSPARSGAIFDRR